MKTSAPRWVSTRSPSGESVPLHEAVRRGPAPDGGLYVPDGFPPFSPDFFRGPERAFPDLAVDVLSSWIDDTAESGDWRSAVRGALSFAVPVVALEGLGWNGIHVLELFHGPTLSFKDFGARTMARLLAAGGVRGCPHVFVATSGDTGSAVADAFSGLAGFRVVLLYPDGQVSPVQERQLTTRRPGVASFRVRGSFDDCQRLAKAVFRDPRFESFAPTSANSINAGRLLPQMLYYVRAAGLVGGRPRFCVPSGNLGNLTAGIMAMLSGMPCSGFIAAHNANDSFARFLAGEEPRFQESVRTLSNAMDVGAPSNFERLIHLMGPERLRTAVAPVTVSDEETMLAMRRIHDATGYVADPHTAVGLEAAWRHRADPDPGTPVVVLSTAHPAKFPETVDRALGFTPDEPEPLRMLADRPSRVQSIGSTLDELLVSLADADFSA